MNWIDLIKQFPAIWAVLGGALGSILASAIFVFANRKYPVLMAAQTKNLTDLHERQIVAQKDLLEMQKTHYEQELADVRAACDRQLAEVKTEKDDYKEKLHTEKNNHTATNLELQEWKLKPDVSKLYEEESKWNEERKQVYQDFAETLKSIRDSITSHEVDTMSRVVPITDALTVLVANSTKQGKALQILLRERRTKRA